MAGNRKMVQDTKTIDTKALRAQIAALEAELRHAQRDLEELRHKESLYRGLVELAPDAMLVHDDHCQIVYINAAGARLFGADRPDQIIGTLASSYICPDDRNVTSRDINSLIAQNTSSTILEQRRQKLDGTSYIADVSVAAIHWDGKPAALVVVRDVSDRLHARAKYESAEALRREAHQRLLDAIEAMNDGFALFDADDRLQVYNRHYVEDVWGKDADFIRPGLTFRELADYAIRIGHWDYAADSVETAIDHALDRHRNLPSTNDIHYATGSWMRQAKRRTRDGGVVAVYADISEIKQNEAVLKESETRYRVLLEALPDAVFIHVDEKIAFVNAAAIRLFGADNADQIIGLESLSLVPEEMRDLHRSRRDKTIAEQTMLPPVEQTRLRLDGSVVDVETIATYIEWEGKPGYLGVMRDITQRKQAQRQTRETERRYSAVVEHMPGAVFQRVLAPDGTLSFTYVSPGIFDILGYSAEEIMSDGRQMVDCLLPDFRDEYFSLINDSAQNLTPLDIELPLRDIAGTPRWVRASGHPRREKDGAIVWDGIITDITEQKRAEQRAREAHQWLLAAISVLPSGFMLWDQDDRLILWNEQVKSYHLDPNIFREGTSFEDLIAGPYGDVLRREGEEEATRWITARRDQHRLASGALEFRTRERRWLVLTERGTPDGQIVTLISDVTERRESEERLKESDERYRALVNLLPDAVYVHKDGVIVLSNGAANTLFGAESSDDLVGLTLMELTHPEFRDVVTQRAAILAEPGQRTVFMRQKRLRLDGSWFWAEVAAAAFEWDNSRGGIVVIRDVTEQMQAEELLIQSKETAELASRAKTEFLANISHELRTPLNAIIGFSDLIQREMFGPIGVPQYADYIRDIYASGNHLHDVINDILDLSKIEAGKLELHEEIFDLGAVIGRCLRVVAPRADENSLKLVEDIAANLPRVRGDERKIKQILINLLSNAVKFTEKGGQISVSAQCGISGNAGDGIAIVVADNGIGMAAEDIPRALMPFGQVDSALSRRHEGTGLGLPLTNSLIELHGGRLEIDSTPGQGTSVTVWLPDRRIVAQSSAAE
jgi:PAS domain S-box-containing protein